MKFLYKGPLPAGYTAASVDWVSEVLCDTGGTRKFSITNENGLDAGSRETGAS